MPVISMFYGIIVRMFYYDNKEHHIPHIHIEYAEYKAVIEIHKDELMANWKLVVEGQTIFKIEALK